MFEDSMSRRSLLLGLAAGLVSVPSQAAVLLFANSLPGSLAAALALKQPLVVMVSLARCPACEIVRNNYLAPMQKSDRLQVIQVDMRDDRPLIGFDGFQATHDLVTRNWGIKVAPTVLFFGHGGKEVAERIQGASMLDYYSSYLDSRLADARKAVSA